MTSFAWECDGPGQLDVDFRGGIFIKSLKILYFVLFLLVGINRVFYFLSGVPVIFYLRRLK